MSDLTPINPAPGWYAADIAGQQRWWDGDSWTTHSRQTPVDPAAVRLLGWSSPTRSIVFGVLSGFFALQMLGLAALTFLGSPFLSILVFVTAGLLVWLSIHLFLNVSKLQRFEAATKNPPGPITASGAVERSTIPPGWYGGGVPGEERWWDGTVWTAHARPVGVTTGPPA